MTWDTKRRPSRSRGAGGWGETLLSETGPCWQPTWMWPVTIRGQTPDASDTQSANAASPESADLGCRKEPVTRAGVSLRHWRPEEGPAWDRPLHLEWTETHRGRRGSRDSRPAPADTLEVRTASQGKHRGAWPSRGWAARRCCPPALALCPSRRHHAEAKPLASKHPPAVGTAEYGRPESTRPPAQASPEGPRSWAALCL